MELTKFKPGMPVEIYIARKNEEKQKKLENNIFISSFFDITNNDECIIHIPMRFGRYVSLPLNLEYTFEINSTAGIYTFNGKIIKQGKKENFPVYVVSLTSKVEKIQRRDYFRFSCTIPIHVVPISKETALLPNMGLVNEKIMTKSEKSHIDTEGTIVDISGGGVRFTTKKPTEAEQYLYTTFTLKDPLRGKIDMAVVGRIVKVEYKEEFNIFEHRVEFLFKDTEDRETIIKYIFNEDRRLRKKDQG